MKTNYYVMEVYRNGKQVKLLNPNYLNCPQILADALSKAMNKAQELYNLGKPSKDNVFKYALVTNKSEVDKNMLMDTEQVADEIYNELSRAYYYCNEWHNDDPNKDEDCSQQIQQAMDEIINPTVLAKILNSTPKSKSR